MQKNATMKMGKNAMKPLWVYELGQNIISIE